MNVTRPNLSLVVGLSQAEEKVPASLGTLLCPLRFFYQIVFFCFSTAFGPWRGVNHCTPCFLCRIHSPAIVLPLRWRYKHQYNMKQTGKERQPPKRHRRTEFAALCWGVTARGSLCPSRCPCEWLPRETASSHGGRTRGFSHRRTSSFLPVRVSA